MQLEGGDSKGYDSHEGVNASPDPVLDEAAIRFILETAVGGGSSSDSPNDPGETES